MRKKWKSVAVLFSAVAAVEAFSTPKAAEAQVYWNVTTGDYSTPANWSTNAVPGTAATADITNGGTCTISAADTITVGSVYDGDTTAGTAMNGNVLQTGGTLNVSSSGILVVGHASSLGTYNFTGGVINTLDTGNSVRLFGVASAGPAADQMWISDATGTNTGTVINNAGEFDVAFNSGSAAGAATLTLSGGTINQNNSGSEFAIANGNGTTGIFYMTGGVLNLKSQLWVGEGTSATATGGNGSFIMSGGTVSSSNWVAIGRGSSGTVGNVTGVFNISGGTFTHVAPTTGTGDFEVGSQGINVTATLNLLGGTLSVDHITDESTSGTQTINFNGGVLQNNANDGNFIRQYATTTQVPTLTVGNGGAIFNTSSFTVGLALPLTHSATANATDGGLTKLGTGQFNLSGTSTYTGPTMINAGTVNLLGSLTSNITVASGASIGSFNSSGSPAGSTTGSLTFLGSSSLLVNPTGTQYLTIGGAVTATGASVLVVPTIGTAPANTPTIVLDARGGITGTFGSAGSGSNFIAGVRGTLTEQPDGSGGTDLLITAATAGPANLTWTGSAGNSTFWDVQTTPNWFNTSTNGADLFYQGDNVTFDDTAGSTRVAIQGTSVSPTSVTFNNLNKTYTFTGGAIAGTTGLTVAGGGMVLLDNSNSYTGGTNIANGTLVIGTGGQLSSTTPITLGNAGTSGVLVLGDSTGPVTLAAGSLSTSGTGTGNEVIAGNAATSYLSLKTPAGSTTFTGVLGNGIAGNSVANSLGLIKSGPGTLVLTSSNTYTGGTNIAQGTLSITNSSALGAGPILFSGNGVGATTNVGNGTILATSNVTLSNNFNFGTGAAVFNTGGNTITLTGSLTNIAGTVAQVIQPIGAGNFNLAGTFNVSGGAGDVNNPALLMAGVGETTTISGSGTLSGISSGWYNSNNTLILQPNGPLNISGTGSAFNIGQTTGNGYVYMPSGTVNVAGSLLLGAYDTSYGSFLLGNGTLNIGTNWEIAGGGNLNPNAFFQVSGGTVTVGGQTKVGWGGAGQSTLYLTGGTVNSTGNNFIVGSTPGSTANLTITGGTLSVIGLNVSSNNQNKSGFASLNLDGGTLIETTLKTTSAGATSIVNLNGGTLQANNLSPNFLNFVTQANLFSGGVTFNSAGQSITVPQNINTAGNSSGVYSPTISGSATGYTGIPEVAISGGGGTGATAVATVSNGTVTGFTMTNPGTGYSSAPTFSLIGGGTTTTATISASVNQNAMDGGITKIGSGTLTLSGSSTYTGGTFIKGGTLAAANPNALGTGAAILSGGSTLALTAMPPLVSLNSFYTNTNSPGQGAFTPVINNNGNGSSAMLTSNLGSEATSIFSPGSSYNINDATGFTASFIYNHGTTSSFNATNGTSGSADGVTFTIQTSTPNAIGAAGNALGYAGVNSSTGGIGSSVGVGVDVYLDQLEVGINGFWNTASGAGTAPFISSSTASQVNISYSYNASAGTGTLVESITSLLDGTTYTLAPVLVDIPTLLGGSQGGNANAFIGFTGATGGVNDTQMISNFSFNPNSSTPVLTATNLSNPVSVVTGQSAFLQLSATSGYSSGQVGPITIGAGGSLALTLGTPATGVTRGVLTTPSVNATSGTLDIGPNALDITAQAGSPAASLAAISAMVKAGYANGQWNGVGIVSSTAAADANHLTAVGVIINDSPSSPGTPLYGVNGGIASTFDGATPADGDILAKYTYYGDTNLDGRVDGSDYSNVDSTYASEHFVNGSPTTPISGWYNGDFNYDGVVDGSDYTLMDNAFNSQGASLAAIVASPAWSIGGTSAVPEPASLGLMALTGAGLLGRRGRRVR